MNFPLRSLKNCITRTWCIFLAPAFIIRLLSIFEEMHKLKSCSLFQSAVCHLRILGRAQSEFVLGRKAESAGARDSIIDANESFNDRSRSHRLSRLRYCPLKKLSRTPSRSPLVCVCSITRIVTQDSLQEWHICPIWELFIGKRFLCLIRSCDREIPHFFQRSGCAKYHASARWSLEDYRLWNERRGLLRCIPSILFPL